VLITITITIIASAANRWLIQNSILDLHSLLLTVVHCSVCM
jgi:hypothetical protein